MISKGGAGATANIPIRTRNRFRTIVRDATPVTYYQSGHALQREKVAIWVSNQWNYCNIPFMLWLWSVLALLQTTVSISARETRHAIEWILCFVLCYGFICLTNWLKLWEKDVLVSKLSVSVQWENIRVLLLFL